MDNTLHSPAQPSLSPLLAFTMNENSKLIAGNRPPRVNTSTRPTPDFGTSSSGVGNTMDTVRSVFQLAQGYGDSFRGAILGAIDDWENKGEQKHHDVARNGQAMVNDAFRQLGWGGSGVAAPGQNGASGSATGYDTRPPAYSYASTGSTPQLYADNKTGGT
ncbi:unnamed protein product [Mycena citricolor]|uniref:Uncharacterized protein n=1 Tax=Mycena citricolor TaxID=2018698 RepID=A0AAD2HZ97_9AGAR|nr:unnamed protein product [Mycena citricolor]CAK5284984.1 unnamed protein product [Mycena citricolor]